MRGHIVEGLQLFWVDLTIFLIFETLVGGKGVSCKEVGVAYLVDDVLA